MKKIEKIPIFVKGIFLLIVLLFSIGIYLSIPVLFNYKSIENIIETKFYSDFDINLKINGDIKYQLLPKPHLLISDSSLSIIENNNQDMLVDTKNLKIFLLSNSLYPKSKISFEKFEIQNTNFLLRLKEYNILRNYFHNSKSKPFYIKKSKVFVIDENDETLIISPIDKINFTTSKQDDFKKLNIKGNLFDLNFKSLWKKKYNSQTNSQIEIDFNEPNILIKNQLNYNNNSNFNGLTSINFLNQKIEIDYNVKNNQITLKSDNNNNIQIDTKIELSPFNLNSFITLNKQNLNFLVDELIFSILNLNSNLIGNLGGDIKFLFTNIEHELIRNGNINLNISQKTINVTEVLFNVGKIGPIKTDIKYTEENGDLIFQSSNSLF
ncbi:AsmA family protein, partial [Candidatus Pelagibacter sp.]|nr:AsmA family protein [Candidatus Pelagibacter sp.]